MLHLPTAIALEESEVEQPPAWHRGRCPDGEKHHAPSPARMCATTSPPWLAAAWPCQTTITSQVKWGAFLACTAGCCEEPDLLIRASTAGGGVAEGSGGEVMPLDLGNAW